MLFVRTPKKITNNTIEKKYIKKPKDKLDKKVNKENSYEFIQKTFFDE